MRATPEHLALLRAEEIARLTGLRRMLTSGIVESQDDQVRAASVLERINAKLAKLERTPTTKKR